MSINLFVTSAAGILAAIGLGGILVGASARETNLRQRSFRIGSVAMTMAGLVLLLAGITGYGDSNQFFGGLMLLIFGTGVSLPALKTGATPEAREPAA